MSAHPNDSILYTKEIREAYLTIVNLAPEKPDSAYVLAKKLLSDSESDNYAQLGSGYFGLAEAYYYLHAYDSARMAYTEALKSYREVGDTARMASSYNNIGLIHSYKSEYKKTLEAYEASLRLDMQIGNKDGIAKCLQNIGVIYSNWELYPKSLEYFERSLMLFEELNDSLSVANLTHNIAILQVNLGNYEEALKFYKQSYLTFRKLEDWTGLAHGELSEHEDSCIKISFSRHDDHLEFMIEDNGIGILSARSKHRRSNHKSMAMDITRERIKLLYQNSSDKELDLLVEDLSEHGKSGTRVKFHIPYQELN